MPGDDHGHNQRLARTRRHLCAQAPEHSAVGRYIHADLLGRRSFGEPDQRLDGLQLAEEEPASGKLFRIRPVRQETLGDSRNARIRRLAPSLHPRSNAVDQRYRNENAGVVECRGIRRGDDVSRGAPSIGQIEQSRLPVIVPMPHRLLVRRVDDKTVDGCAGHYLASGGTKGSNWPIRIGRSLRTVSQTRRRSMSK